MAIVIQILQWLLTIGSLICFVLVLIQMFQRGKTGLGIACIVLICCGGPLIAFIYGWIKSQEWGLFNVMLAWTGIIILGFIVAGVGFATGAITIPAR